jgi:hypothetical protein
MAAGFQSDAFDAGGFYLGATAGGASAGGTLVGTNKKAPLYALSGMARAGAFRSGYVPNANWLRLVIGGVNMVGNLWLGSLAIDAQINRRQDTCTFRTFDYAPPRWAEIVVSVDSDSNRAFGGQVQTVASEIGPIDHHNIYTVTCIDYTNALSAAPNGLVVARYKNVPGDLVIRDILARWCPGFSAQHVPTGLPNVRDLVFSGERPGDAIDRTVQAMKANSAGTWTWYVDYHRGLHVLTLEDDKAPSIEPGRYHYAKFTVVRDFTLLYNRYYGIGGGGNTVQDYPAGTTAFGLDSVTWYPAPYAGNVVIVPGAGQAFTLANVDYGTKVITTNEPASYDIPQGSSFDNFVQVDDLASQLRLLTTNPADPALGVRAGYVIDQRMSRDGIIELAQSNLANTANENVWGTYESWRPVRQGQLVDVNLPDKKVWGTFQVQQVRTNIRVRGRRIQRSVTYSSNVVMDLHKIILAVKAARRNQ